MLLINGRFYAVTYTGAKNYKLVSCPVNVDWAHAKTSGEKADESLKNFWRTKDYLLLDYGNGITDLLYRDGLVTLEKPVDFGETAYRWQCPHYRA